MIDKMEMTDLEKDLVELLGARRGAANAITRAQLQECLDGVCDRKMRMAIKHLKDEHGVPIASGPSGYYTPVTPEEVKKTCDYYHSYAMSMLSSESRLRGCSLPDIVNQLKIDFENPELLPKR